MTDKCRTCGKKIHYHDPLDHTSLGYCSDRCLGLSPSVQNVIDFINSLSNVKRNKLIDILNNTYEEEMGRALNRLRKNNRFKDKKLMDKIEVIK